MSPRNRHKGGAAKALADKFPPSKPCSCEVCVGYCTRPGWWTVEEAAQAVDSGYAHRMMLEMSPDRTYGVLSPAFKGCESNFALDMYSKQGCTFLEEDLCELHATGHQPLECRHCHHADPSAGPRCHAEIEKDWRTPAGQALVVKWGQLTGLWERVNQLQIGKK
jgi:hypothetical protein